MSLEIFIPLLPPGINETYGYGKGHVYKTQKAITWETGAALVIGSEAARQNWVDSFPYYEIFIQFNNWRQDVDAPIKLIIDCVTRKLGFDDRKVLKQTSLKVKFGEPGVIIKLTPMEEITNDT